MGPWASGPNWDVIYMLEMAVEGGRGGDWIIGGWEKRGHKEGPDKSCPLPNPACFGVCGVNICCGLLSSTTLFSSLGKYQVKRNKQILLL